MQGDGALVNYSFIGRKNLLTASASVTTAHLLSESQKKREKTPSRHPFRSSVQTAHLVSQSVSVPKRLDVLFACVLSVAQIMMKSATLQ